MGCLLCGTERVTRRIVDQDTDTVAAEVCEQCAEEYLLIDQGSPTCELCSEMADYDLAKIEDPSQETTQEDGDPNLDLVEKDVLCEEHLRHLRAEATEP